VPKQARPSLLRTTHRYSWVALGVCWLIWVLNAYDREIILRLGPTISQNFHLSPGTWGQIASLVMLSLALLPLPGSAFSDKYGGGHRRARFQVPLVIGYTALSCVSGFKLVSSHLVAFIATRVGVNLGTGWGEPVGVSNTAEWWPRERRGFALGAHHTGYPIGSLLSGIIAAAVLSVLGPGDWSYSLFLGVLIAVPLMLFWGRYSTSDKITTLYADITAKGMTAPGTAPSGSADGAPAPSQRRLLLDCLRNRDISLVAATTLLTQVVYMGVNVVLPPYLHNVVGLSLAASAGLSVVFTLTGVIGQVLWPTLSDVIGRRVTIVVCGVWMAIAVACFYFATTSLLVVLIQLAFGLVANAVWPVYYAAVSDVAPAGATSTTNGIVTTAMFIGGGIAPVAMGSLISAGGGWSASGGYAVCFFLMAGCAAVGAVLALFTRGRGAVAGRAVVGGPVGGRARSSPRP
jgi:MFS family permease